jgi:hypothetical protein
MNLDPIIPSATFNITNTQAMYLEELGAPLKWVNKHLSIIILLLDLFRLNSIWYWLTAKFVETGAVDNIFYLTTEVKSS